MTDEIKGKKQLKIDASWLKQTHGIQNFQIRKMLKFEILILRKIFQSNFMQLKIESNCKLKFSFRIDEKQL